MVAPKTEHRKRTELEQALTGQIRPHHRFLIANHLTHLDFLEEQIAVFNDQIASHIAHTPPSEPKTPPSTATCDPTPTPGGDNLPLSWEKAITLLDTIPGLDIGKFEN